jgi:hypothetical protein
MMGMSSVASTRFLPAIHTGGGQMTSPNSSVSYSRKHHPLYGTWRTMRQRCLNPNCKDYHRYGGRGITVCKRWLGTSGFDRFIADMGPRPSKEYSIERCNNNRGYTPLNCKWATRSEQHRNTRQTRNLTFNGKTQCVQAWAEELDIKRHVIVNRLKMGWDVVRILTQPIHKRDLAFNGKTQSVTAWAREVGMPMCRLQDRLNRGWSVQQALTS